jgi:hypothetical protein
MAKTATDETPDVAEDTETVEVPAATMDYVALIEANYSQYVSTRLLTVDGVPAFGAGSAVNADHPLLAGWLDDGGVVER